MKQPPTSDSDTVTLVDAPDVLFCPRCGGDLAEREFYGVCGTCADVLRSEYDGLAKGDVQAVEYEPKMNVTPNAVASKE